jgi:glycosyltransferase involved in cell wall biosynthesis
MSPERGPRIAVVVPCYNDGATLGEAVDSVRAQAEPCELVIVDDGSTDPLTLRRFEELEREGVRVVRQENRGLSAARMAGVRATGAPYLYPLDADDALFPASLTPLADVLDREPSLAAVWGDTVVFGDIDRVSRVKHRLDPWAITHFNGVPYAAMFRREILEQVGGWQLHAGGYEDWDLWMMLAERGHRAVRLQGRVLRYRVHGQRMWTRAADMHGEIYAELRRRHPELFDRRRRNWRSSKEPWRIKLLVPVVSALPLISSTTRRRLYSLVRDPVWTLGVARERLAERR